MTTIREQVRLLADETPASAAESFLRFLYWRWRNTGSPMSKDFPCVPVERFEGWGFPSGLVRSLRVKGRRFKNADTNDLLGSEVRFDHVVQPRKVLQLMAEVGNIPLGPEEPDAKVLKKIKEAFLPNDDDEDTEEEQRFFRVFRES